MQKQPFYIINDLDITIFQEVLNLGNNGQMFSENTFVISRCYCILSLLNLHWQTTTLIILENCHLTGLGFVWLDLFHLWVTIDFSQAVLVKPSVISTYSSHRKILSFFGGFLNSIAISALTRYWSWHRGFYTKRAENVL